MQATTEWEAALALVSLQEDGLGVHLPVHVCCYCMLVHDGGSRGGKQAECQWCGKRYFVWEGAKL